jgi:hypothetical protein
MSATSLIGQLQRGPGVIGGLLDGLDSEAMRWRPAPDKWSALEVVCHLADEEREDFRLRLDLALHQPGRTWPGIDPPAWVTERGYQEREPADALEDFMHERAKSLIWLQGIDPPDWELAYEHPQIGVIRAGDLLASWAGHDLLHLRQLVSLRFHSLAQEAVPYTADYAGSW